MDFTQTNNNPDVNWSDRTLPGHAAAPPTACVGGRASPGQHPAQGHLDQRAGHGQRRLRPQLATLVKNTLSPGLPVYVEYSNEVWNYSFTQAHYNKSAAVAEVKADPQRRT